MSGSGLDGVHIGPTSIVKAQLVSSMTKPISELLDSQGVDEKGKDEESEDDEQKWRGCNNLTINKF